MGQRSQIYIRMTNIGKTWAKNEKLDKPKEWRDKLPEYVEKQEIYNKWKKMYGEKETIIVAFHHQWLYGRSFVLMAANILFTVKSIQKGHETDNIFHKEYNYLENPNDVIAWLKNYMQNLFDFELSTYARSSIERLHLLNEEHLDEDFSMCYSEDFTRGDNNDGVLLMDFTTAKPKYCFVNIHGDSTVEKLPYLNPVGADKYLKAYYPEGIKGMIEKEGADKPLEELQKKIKQNITVNKKFLKRYKEVPVLTVDEVIEMFPKMKKELEKENKKVLTESV